MTEEKRNTDNPADRFPIEYIVDKVSPKQKSISGTGPKMRHDRQRLHTAKGFRLQAESKAYGKAEAGHESSYMLPRRSDKLHVRSPWHEPGKAKSDV